eukprot:COSAG04_NODE_17968_length_454_cov_1.408451_2_plen_75_part_01
MQQKRWLVKVPMKKSRRGAARTLLHLQLLSHGGGNPARLELHEDEGQLRDPKVQTPVVDHGVLQAGVVQAVIGVL